MDHGTAAAAGPGAGGAMIVSSEMDANLTSMQHQIQLN
jgi:hypothetical protein